MNSQERSILNLDTVKEVHSLMGLPVPLSPLITIIDHAQTQDLHLPVQQKLLMNLYNNLSLIPVKILQNYKDIKNNEKWVVHLYQISKYLK